MLCDGCGNLDAYRLSIRGGSECCDTCGQLSRVQFSDVYFREAYMDPHLIDVTKPEQNDGVWISSREQKARLLREKGLREIGDRQHGGRDFSQRGWDNFKKEFRVDVRRG